VKRQAPEQAEGGKYHRKHLSNAEIVLDERYDKLFKKADRYIENVK